MTEDEQKELDYLAINAGLPAQRPCKCGTNLWRLTSSYSYESEDGESCIQVYCVNCDARDYVKSKRSTYERVKELGYPEPTSAQMIYHNWLQKSKRLKELNITSLQIDL